MALGEAPNGFSLLLIWTTPGATPTPRIVRLTDLPATWASAIRQAGVIMRAAPPTTVVFMKLRRDWFDMVHSSE
jgi:hypothetical protein